MVRGIDFRAPLWTKNASKDGQTVKMYTDLNTCIYNSGASRKIARTNSTRFLRGGSAAGSL